MSESASNKYQKKTTTELIGMRKSTVKGVKFLQVLMIATLMAVAINTYFDPTMLTTIGAALIFLPIILENREHLKKIEDELASRGNHF